MMKLRIHPRLGRVAKDAIVIVLSPLMFVAYAGLELLVWAMNRR